MNKITLQGLDEEEVTEVLETLKQRILEGAVVLDLGKYDDMLPTVMIQIDRTNSSIDVIKEEGMPLGMLEKATFRIAREVQKVRSQKRFSFKKDEYQDALTKVNISEGQEMAISSAETKTLLDQKIGLPSPTLDKASTRQ